ncbi:MAG: 2-isopropylmalate synthase [Opitutales bacterium]|nr:2-isopropylmalate synthase [Opitutales bacterium]MCH8540919.1 2-isopropylmalate synthase [Opitutales bacterium]
MQKSPITKYQPFPQIDLKDREWPGRTITQAPIWCSVDLRDGNQALPIPMKIEEKLEMFDLLVKIGFKEIEVGFPSASKTEYDFLRRLIDEGRIPADVTVQVLTQSREDLIRKSFEAIDGAPRAIVHLYNSTSPAQRRLVFGLEKPEIIAIATKGTALVRELADQMKNTEVMFQYSPESFSGTEMPFALEICEAVASVWGPTPEKKMILNLPATVELATPNVHADQIEWFRKNLTQRENFLISLHTHNDRGTGIAATELGLLAGADRVEGTLFGNGERTGNVDIVTLALNMYTQGVHPGLDFSDLNGVRQVYEKVTKLDVPIRLPYAGELVFTAFSGSHQDAINKGLAKMDPTPGALWEVPYLPIDPKDIGRSYRAIIRINSQSGKGGVAYIMEKEFGFQMPKMMHKEFGKIVNDVADETGMEITPKEVWSIFEKEYLQRKVPIDLLKFSSHPPRDQSTDPERSVECEAKVILQGVEKTLHGSGNGPIAAFFDALTKESVPKVEFLSYSEHSLGRGANSRAVSYVEVKREDGSTCFGAGIDTNIDMASVKAVVSAINRAALG